jgi:hypothetical protein
LEPGWRWTASVIERFSLYQLATRLFSTLSTTFATSESLTGAPLRQATTTLRYSSALRMACVASSVTFWRGPVMVPTGAFELVCAITRLISSSEMLRAAAATGSTWTRIANFCEP